MATRYQALTRAVPVDLVATLGLANGADHTLQALSNAPVRIHEGGAAAPADLDDGLLLPGWTPGIVPPLVAITVGADPIWAWSARDQDARIAVADG